MNSSYRCQNVTCFYLATQTSSTGSSRPLSSTADLELHSVGPLRTSCIGRWLFTQVRSMNDSFHASLTDPISLT